jgi:hypothetical protein
VKSKYTHHKDATIAKPTAAVKTEAARQEVSETPVATSKTHSPRTIIVNRPNLSGTCDVS